MDLQDEAKGHPLYIFGAVEKGHLRDSERACRHSFAMRNSAESGASDLLVPDSADLSVRMSILKFWKIEGFFFQKLVQSAAVNTVRLYIPHFCQCYLSFLSQWLQW